MFDDRTHDPCRVLVVDDDALVRARLSAVLNATHYDVELAGTGEEALRVLDSVNCHIVVTDWQMPDMDGLALCRHIRSRHQESYIYVLMLSIRDTRHDVSTGLAAGADAYVFKSAPIDDILARMEIGRRIAYDKPSRPRQSGGTQGASHVDPVTGAYNLAYPAQHLPRELARPQRFGHSLSILHCDMGGFDAFCEQRGHEAGNELMREFVACAVTRIRKGDWFARASCASVWIVLPETAAKGAQCATKQFLKLSSCNHGPSRGSRSMSR
jgi:PleD family two-component response regulator